MKRKEHDKYIHIPKKKSFDEKINEDKLPDTLSKEEIKELSKILEGKIVEVTLTLAFPFLGVAIIFYRT